MRGLGCIDGIQIFVLVHKPGSTLILLRLVTCVNELCLSQLKISFFQLQQNILYLLAPAPQIKVPSRNLPLDVRWYFKFICSRMQLCFLTHSTYSISFIFFYLDHQVSIYSAVQARNQSSTRLLPFYLIPILQDLVVSKCCSFS